MTKAKGHVNVKCRECGVALTVKRSSYETYRVRKREFLCDECRIKVARERNAARVNGRCDQCGKFYSAHKITYEHNRRNDRKCYCPPCAHKISGLALSAANLIRFARNSSDRARLQAERDAVNRYEAPCGRTIENATEARNKRHEGACFECNWAGRPEYDACLAMADKRCWDGWREVRA